MIIELCINFANPTRKFKTILSVSFDIKIVILAPDSFSYDERCQTGQKNMPRSFSLNIFYFHKSDEKAIGHKL